MFSKKNKTIFDYVTDHNPYNPIETLKRNNYLEGTVSVEHKELEQDIVEYWDLLHPLVADFINSYAITYEKMAKELAGSRDEIEGVQRSLSFEQNNVNKLTDEIRELKRTLQEEATVRRDLESRLQDERSVLESQFAEEKRALEVIANSKVGEDNLKSIMSDLKANAGSPEETQRLNKKIEELENQIKSERKENEKIQGELSTSFMEKITHMDEMIRNYKERLGEK